MQDERGLIEEARNLGNGYQLLKIAAPRTAEAAKPGQFVMVRILPALDPLLRRPLGILDARPPYIWLYYQVLGSGTRLLAAQRPGDSLEILGPLGNTFPELPGQRVLLIAGGRGIVPLFHYARAYDERRQLLMLYGGRSKADLPLLDRIRALRLERLFIFSEDGSLGQQGRLSDGLERIVRDERPDATFSCGPEAMLAALAALLKPLAAASVPARVARFAPRTAPTAVSVTRGRSSPWRRSNGRPERRPGFLHAEEPGDRGIGHFRLRRGIPAFL
jgi:dihydroorotate dehydrogenase electron transfer subunit